MQAIISDIHANLEALEAVLKDIKSKNIQDIICLGDIIGYGPNPRECLKLAQEFKFCLRGNHEEAVMYLGIDFHNEAVKAINWTKEILNSPSYDKQENYSFWDFLDRLIRQEELNDMLYVHGSPCDPTREYLKPQDIKNNPKMKSNFNALKHVCFCGHTHYPGVFVYPSSSDQAKFHRLKELDYTYAISSDKCIINVGSVGQPRDGDNRACYITLDNNKITYHRVAYDYKKTMQKIRLTKSLPELCAKRLEAGH